MLDQPTNHSQGLRAKRSTRLPVEKLIVGKTAQEAADLLPRLFNLCRVAQGAAARLAFGLHLEADLAEQIRLEILREHLIAFYAKLPAHFGAPLQSLPEGWQEGTASVRRDIFGASGDLPTTKADFVDFLESGQGVARTLGKIRDSFAPGEACGGRIPSVSAASALSATALENSVAGRQASHPVLCEIEQSFGRGPLWRATARAYDAQDCINGSIPDLISPTPGVAIVPAARGTYAISARADAGIVTAFRRITPTDHLLARGGILDQSLASLPLEKAGLAPLLLNILDPCTPVQLETAAHA